MNRLGRERFDFAERAAVELRERSAQRRRIASEERQNVLIAGAAKDTPRELLQARGLCLGGDSDSEHAVNVTRNEMRDKRITCNVREVHP